MDNNNKEKSWYKKKRYIVPLAVVGLIFALGSGNNSSNSLNNEYTSTPLTNFTSIKTDQTTSTVNALPTVKSSTQDTYPSNNYNNLSNDNYYTNTYGNQVHSPAYSNSVPVGASARCGDGTYSFSQSRRGTCSHHGGVSEWLN